MTNEKNKSNTGRNRLTVIANPNYKEEAVEVKGWRKAAEIFNRSKSECTADDIKEELRKMRKEQDEE